MGIGLTAKTAVLLHAFARGEYAVDLRTKYKTDAITKTTAASRRPARVSLPTELWLSAA